MEFTRPIFWRHGLFLQPQHLQLNDLFLESRLAPLWEFLQPYFWGVAEMDIQESALATMSFEILSGKFLFPSGVYAVFPGNAVVERRSFEDAWENWDKPITIYLGLRTMSQMEPNVTVVEELRGLADIKTRFVAASAPEEVRDLYLNGQAGQVQGMQYQLRLFWQNETALLENYEIIPIARLEKVTERVRLLPSFIPPVLSLRSADRLFALVRDIRDRLAARGRQLEGYKRLKNLETGESESRYISYIMALSCLNRHIPVLSQMCESGTAHPHDAYLALRQLVAELSTFSTSIDVMGETLNGEKVPPYNHTTLWDCFSRVQNAVEIALADFITGPEYIIPLERDGDNFLAEKLSEDVFQPRNHYYLVFWTSLDLQQIFESLAHLTRVTSRSYMPTITKRALAGIELSFLAQPPREAIGSANSYFFRLNDTDKQWESVVNERCLAMQWEGAPKDLKVELMVIRR
ncbi:MAG: type VI secretion system baseplate subunit TssK [Desulfobulbaceae bacterium]|jgi:type VI secretion system protein ImpJ|nr:type VI secretion system baseplate subunit TssK [Desulfobulbaceae bacterium]